MNKKSVEFFSKAIAVAGIGICLSFSIPNLVKSSKLFNSVSDSPSVVIQYDDVSTMEPCNDGLGGTIFIDQNGDGQIDIGQGLDGIEVYLYAIDEDDQGQLVETVTTDEDGNYNFTISSLDEIHKIVFGSLPAGYSYTLISEDNQTDVQFVSTLGCDNNVGVINDIEVCASPELQSEVNLGDEFENGKLLGPGIAMLTCGTIQNLPAGDRHTVGLMDMRGISTAANRPEVNPSSWYHPSWHVDSIGNVFGIEYDTSGNIYVTASSHYSHVFGYILGPNTSNYTQAVIRYGDLGGGASSTAAAGTVYKLDAVTGQASVFAQLPQQAFGFSHLACEAADPPLARTTGVGLGNIVYDPINDQFFVSNFEDGKIYRIGTNGSVLSMFDPQTLDGFEEDDGSAGWAPDAKPYGLAISAQGDEVYFGTHELNTNPGLYSVKLSNSGDFMGSEIFHRNYIAEGDIGYLYAQEPGWVAISDLEIMPDGKIMIGLRTGCAGAYATSHNHGGTFYIAASTDNDGIYDDDIVNTDIQYPSDVTSNDDGYGGIGVWDRRDGTYEFLVSSSDTRTEEGPHGMILFPHDFTNGNSGFSLQPSVAIPYIPSFNVNDFKGVGGDVEVFSPCGESSVNVGNFVWIDANGNGVQDPDELPATGIDIKLYKKIGVTDVQLVATTTTNNSGQYYFTDSESALENWEEGFAEIEKEQDYAIVICSDSFDAIEKIVELNSSLYSISVPNVLIAINDQDDSDLEVLDLPDLGEVPAICFTTSSSNYTFDAGLVLKPTVMINGVNVTCGPVEEGGSLHVEIEGGLSPFTYDWSENDYDGMSNISNVPLGTYSLTVTDATNCTSETTVEITQEACAPDPCVQGQLGGQVFSDQNANGINENGENGPQGIRVQIFACNADGSSELVETVYTDPNGDYHFNSTSIEDGIKYRIEFSTIPDGYTSSIQGADNGTETQYVDEISCEVDFGLLNPLTYCQSNPMMVTPCYVSSTSANEDVLIRFSYTNEGTADLDKLAISESQMTGSLWGVAYAKKTKTLFTSAVLKGHIPLGPAGLDAIYTTDPFSGTPNAAPWIELTDDLGIAVSGVTAQPQYLDNTARGLDEVVQNDAAAFEDVGKVGIGDIELSEDEETLYVVNLFDKTLYAISTITKEVIGTYPITLPACNLGVARPWALAERNGEIYVGVTCDGSESGVPSNLTDNSGAVNLSATVYRLDGPTFVEVLSFPLNYSREEPFHYSANCVNIDRWKPWLGLTMPADCGDNDGNISYPTPLLTDIEFAANGDMVLGLTDRTGYQFGYANYGPTGTSLHSTYAAGDILKACKTTDGWEIESVVSGCASDGQAINSIDPAGYTFLENNNVEAKDGEFFKGDYFHGNGGTDGTGLSYFPGHPEIATGGLAIVPGTGEVITTSYDPVTGAANYNTGGVIFLDLETGKRTRNGYQLYATVDPNTTLGKGIGLGDLEALCDLAPIQLGNYVWIDANSDGIQDPCEEPVDGLTVKLYTKPSGDGEPTLVATTTTNSNGEYYFTDSLDTDEMWEDDFAEVEKDSTYYIVFCGDSYNAETDVINSDGLLFSLTVKDSGMGANPDFNDSDAEELTLGSVGDFPAICVTADSINHTYDVGLLPKPDLALVMTLDPDYDPAGLQFGDSVKFKIVVTNQALSSVDSVEITNYFPAGFTFDENISGNGDWSTNGEVNPVTTISNTIASMDKDSVCIYLTLEPSDDPKEWVTVSEISNAWLLGEEIEDCDSPLNDNPEDNVGSEINTPADDNIDGNGSATEPDGVAETDQDNVDPAAAPICDLALINQLAELSTGLSIGDTVKYEVILENQGTIPATNIDIQYTIPIGLAYVESNDDLDPTWTSTPGAATTTIDEVLGLGEMDTVCIYLTVENVSTDVVSADSWTTFAEISAFQDSEDSGIDKSDVDSTPDTDPENDSGGNPDDETDNETGGDGSGDPEDPEEDSDPALDEDDHDPAIIYVCDVATIIDTEDEGPFSYGDAIKYFVEVHNQGNGDITAIDLQNLYGEGLEYIDDEVNELAGWVKNEAGELSLLIEETLEPGDVDTICLYMEIVMSKTPSEESWLQNVEVVSFEDPNEPGESKEDIDSTPDDDPVNDSGGNPDDETDDVIEGDGSGDPEDPQENIDPTKDEDDQDTEDIEICDIALINKVVELPESLNAGDTIKYEVVLSNQGNTIANSVSVDYLIPNGLSYLDQNDDQTPPWTEESLTLASITTDEVLAPGESDTVCIYLAIENVASELVTKDSWTTIAEITSFTDEDDAIKLEDVDSTPDDDPTNDSGGNPDDGTDNETGGDGSGDPQVPEEDSDPTLDEDDHDPAIIYVCDVATIIDTEDEGPFSYGDTIKYFVEVYNQGNGNITAIDLQNLYGEGLEYIDDEVNELSGWVLNEAGELSLLIEETLEPGNVDTICLYMEIVMSETPSEESWLQNVEVVSFEDPNEPGESKEDIDSTPDDDPDNDPGGNSDDDTDDVIGGDGSGDPEDPQENIDPTKDEDDQDTEDIEICDLALINQIAELPESLKAGDTIKYEVVLSNQGNTIANSVSVDYLIPNGLSYLDQNDAQTPSWTEESLSLASITTDEVLAPGESDTVCIYLAIENVASELVTEDSWTTIAEITSFTDEEDEDKLEDVDSTPDDDPTNDSGGNPDDDTDNETGGDGSGDPQDPEEDSDPTLDEDDHDPAIIYVCDVATIIDTEEEGPFSYGDTIKYFVEVHNQGNGDITAIDLQNLYGEGLEYIDDEVNELAGWELNEAGKLSLLIEETLEPGDVDTICLYMEIVMSETPSEENWLQNVEVVSFEDPEEPGESKEDIDSTPDDDPVNDSGGNPDDDTDDVIDGDGSGDPDDPQEDTDPTKDEDDQDTEDIEICDIALVNKIVEIPTPPTVGDIIKYEVIVYNQGNTIANSVDINYLIPNGLIYMDSNDDHVPAWTDESGSLASITTDEVLSPGETDTVCIYLTVNDLATDEATLESWTTIAEITQFTDAEGEVKTEDVDSTPDDDFTNDSGGNPNDDTDNETGGDGTGDPNDSEEDSDPVLDEDDHDATNIYVCDVATIIDTEDIGPFSYGDTVKYFIEVHNQGNGPITNIALQNLYGEGLLYVDNSENSDAGWILQEDGKLSLLVDEVIATNDTVTICLLMEVGPVTEVTDDSWIQNIEVVKFEDPAESGIAKFDVDSTPDDNPDNDPGGNADDDTDDETSGDGSGDLEDPIQDGNPAMDEDDQDVEEIAVFDLALRKTVENEGPTK